MSPHETEAILKRELNVDSLSVVFEWIDLQDPLGSASIAQVHKAKLRRYVERPTLLRRALTVPLKWCGKLSRALMIPSEPPVLLGDCVKESN